MKIESFYRNLPTLAGLGALVDAMKPGLSVEECVFRLKRVHYAFRRLHQIFTARITAEPIYELKMGFSLHAHLCAEHVAALRLRVGEMREPPLGLDQVPNSYLEVFFDEILAAPTTEELLLGLYEKALPVLKLALENHRRDSNPLTDAPSIRICRFAVLEVEDMLDFGQKCIASLVDQNLRGKAKSWLALLDEALTAAGGLDGRQESNKAGVSRHYSAKPYQYDPVPKRDERFPDPYNMGVNAEVFLYDEKYPPTAKTLMMLYKRLREIDVPEMMASIITETTGKPWNYYRDMTRQLWDEARHAMMGEVGLAKLGVDWPNKVMVNHTWALALNTQLKPIERHAVLYFIEQGLMPKTGKRYEWELAIAANESLAASFQDYDWADEVLHARVGRDWYLKEFPNPQAGIKYGDECWSRIFMNFEIWRKEGRTQHRNWWPDAYRDACEHWKIEPHREALAYHTTYECVRADLKEVTGSA